MQLRSSPIALLLSGFACCQSAYAEGLGYLDVDGLVRYGAPWVIALLIMLVGTVLAFRSRHRLLAAACGIALAGVFVAPFAAFKAHGQKFDAELQAALRNSAAETAFCRPEIDPPSVAVRGEQAVSILLRVSEKAAAFPSRSLRFPNSSHQTDSAGIVRMLTDEWLVCNRTRVRSIQIDLPSSRNTLCHAEADGNPKLPDDGSQASYELVIGEDWKESKYPEPEAWGETRMAQASIRISELSTGRLLALRRSAILLSGDYGRSHECRHLVRELPAALAAVFPR